VTLNPKSQAPNLKQISIAKSLNPKSYMPGIWNINGWYLEIVWDLDFRAWDLVSSTSR
jgi:hypothetical protein